MWDAVIVGAGPAGAMTAYHLAAKGYAVLLLDRQQFPREKVCGDALIPDAISCLQRAGIYDDIQTAAHPVSLLRIYSPSRHLVDIPGTFLTIKRFFLDRMLVEAAVSKGATMAQGQVDGLSMPSNDEITVTCDKDTDPIRARVAILATGADVSLSLKLGMIEQPRASAISLRCYVRTALKLDRIVVSFDRSIIPGYAWIFPMGGDEYNVGCGIFSRFKSGEKTNLRTMFSKFLYDFPLAKELMAKGEIVSPIKGARMRCGLAGTQPVKDRRILAVGETIGTTFPFTGEGIGKAMETGVIAASRIHEAFTRGDISLLNGFPEYLEQTLRPRYLGYKVAEEWLSADWLCDFLIRRAQKSAYLRNAAAGIISETVDPRNIFSIRGLIKSLVN